MKRALYIILFSVMMPCIVIGITWLIGSMSSAPLYQGEDEANRNFGYFLIAFCVAIPIGGILGNVIYKKTNNTV